MAYNSNFTVGASIAGFDVRTNGYGSNPIEANNTVRPIPWSATYAIVIQRGGQKPHERTYRVQFNTEADFIALALLVNRPGGLLTTPREQQVSANLDRIARGETDPSTPIGFTTAELAFTLFV